MRGQLVQIPSTVKLRREHATDGLMGKRAEHAVLERRRRMHDPTQRILARSRIEQVAQLLTIRDVAADYAHRCAELPKLCFELLHAWRPGALPAGKYQIAHTVDLNQVPRHQPTQVARAPCNQHRALGIEPPAALAGDLLALALPRLRHAD